MDLTGRRALVTGAGRGLGAEVARHLAASGAWVAVHFRQHREGAESTATAVRDAGGEALVLQGDLADPTQVAGVVGAVEAAWGGLDLLVNNAGAAPPW